jgi:hypothetical protein
MAREALEERIKEYRLLQDELKELREKYDGVDNSNGADAPEPDELTRKLEEMAKESGHLAVFRAIA